MRQTCEKSQHNGGCVRFANVIDNLAEFGVLHSGYGFILNRQGPTGCPLCRVLFLTIMGGNKRAQPINAAHAGQAKHPRACATQSGIKLRGLAPHFHKNFLDHFFRLGVVMNNAGCQAQGLRCEVIKKLLEGMLITPRHLL